MGVSLGCLVNVSVALMLRTLPVSVVQSVCMSSPSRAGGLVAFSCDPVIDALLALAVHEKTYACPACLPGRLGLFVFSSCLLGAFCPLLLLSRRHSVLAYRWCSRDGLTAGICDDWEHFAAFLFSPPYGPWQFP